ncbi:hypothetical protein [Clostridium perfringens]|uniref:hypothetical protein n=1 Tax=Clostridium perfringens TaxID=1502 RepID=UPI00399D124B
MDYKFIALKESEKFFEQYESGKLDQGTYVVENEFDYTVIKNTGRYLTVEFFGTLEGCKRYLEGKTTVEEVLKWERERAKRREKLTYILFYLMIFSMVLLLLYLIKI